MTIREDKMCETADQLHPTLNLKGYKPHTKKLYWRSVVDATRRAIDATGCITRAKLTKALQHYYQGALAPLKQVVDQLEAGGPVTEKGYAVFLAAVRK